ncbi:MAG: ABC transporter ATP-binding protein [bacterium]
MNESNEPTAPALVEVRDLVRRFGTVTAVDGASFTVAKGEMFGLIGPDGAGKSTTLRTILGLLVPDAGEVRACGLHPIREARALAGRVGYLAQRFSLYGDLTVDENVAFFAEVHDVRRWKPRRDELLELLKMARFRTRLADRLSGGMKQKLALACTLIHSPELLILDEPTTGVDPVSRRDFWRILFRLQREGLTLLLTTPYLDEAERCQRVALMSGGRVLTIASPTRLRDVARAEHGALLEVLARPKRAAQDWLRARPEVSDLETFGERLHVQIHGGATEALAERFRVALAAEGLEVLALRAVAPSLEDIFIARVRSAESSAPPATRAEERA